MATFYVLPSRPQVGRHVAELLFPGLDAGGADLVEALATAAQDRPGVYVIFREDVPDGVELTEALARVFGAEPTDRVIEVTLGPRPARAAA